MTGIANEMSAMSLFPVLGKSEFMKKLEVPMRLVSSAFGANDMNVLFALNSVLRQCAAVKIVRERTSGSYLDLKGKGWQRWEIGWCCQVVRRGFGVGAGRGY